MLTKKLLLVILRLLYDLAQDYFERDASNWNAKYYKKYIADVQFLKETIRELE